MNQNTPATLINDMLRSVGVFFDRPCFWLLGLMYKIFFNVASADIFSSGTILSFYKRVQLIIGVFMLFQLTITIIRGIINPEEMTDGKGGKNNVIYRVMVSLFMLVAIMPINIPGARSEYQIQLNNNGLLFGTLYSLQYRILNNNTIGRLVLGTNSVSSASTSSTTSTASNSTEENLEKASNIFTSTILKGFVRINLKDGKLKDPGEGKEPEVLNENRMCTDIDEETLKIYTKIDADPDEIFDIITASCTSAKSSSWFGEAAINKALGFFKRLAKTDRYVFAYIPILPAITAIIFTVILLSFTIEVAMRAVKLALLRLIAPIPILSYMDPKGSKDGAFNSWVKALTSTYLELFVRLALVYFVLYLIQDIIVHGLVINTTGGMVGVLSLILIFIGLFAFAKQAPKYLKEVLGIKSDFKLFGGLQEAKAALSVPARAISGGISSGAASIQKDGNIGKGIATGIFGGIKGAVGGTKDYMSQDKTDAKGLWSNVRANSAKNYQNIGDNSTTFGRFAAGVQSNLGLKNKFQRMEDKINDYGAATAAWKRINTALDSDDKKITYSGPDVKDKNGNVLFKSGGSYSSKDANDILGRMKSSGQYSASEIEAMEEAKKKMQTARFEDIRKRGADKEKLTGTEAQIFQGQQTIHSIGKKYANDDDKVFEGFAGTEVNDKSLSMGKNFKGAAFNAERTADAMKNSSEYSTAKANAQRAEQKK